MGKLNLAVIFGGCSPEHEISKISAATVISNISEEQYNVIPVYITKEGQWLLYDGSIDNIKNVRWDRYGTSAVLSPDRLHKGLLRIVGDKVKLIPVDVAFPVLHGRNGEDGTIQGLLELAGIPYVGSGVTASALAMDKAFEKTIADTLGIRQAMYLCFKKEDIGEGKQITLDELCKKVRTKLKYPCFVKPSVSGSSIGINKVTNKQELLAAIDEAFGYDDKIIIEKGIRGREFECGVLGTGGDDTEASAVGEIIPAAEFYDYDSKYNSKESMTIVPADIPESVADEIRITAVKIFKALDCKGLARVDFFLEEETEKVVLNEINTIPGLTPISLYLKLWDESGVSIPGVIDRLISTALKKSARTSNGDVLAKEALNG